MCLEHRPCPRCQVPHTARFSVGVAVCFNCRANWNPRDPEGTLVPHRGAAQTAAPYPFSAPELARLAAYRDAVRAGVYNEGPGGD